MSNFSLEEDHKLIKNVAAHLTVYDPAIFFIVDIKIYVDKYKDDLLRPSKLNAKSTFFSKNIIYTIFLVPLLV